MKAVFPSKGVVIVTKYNVDVLKNFYKNNLINSKLFSIYQQSDYSIQVGNFNYLPKKSNIILDNAHLLTLRQLQEIVAKQIKENPSAVTIKKAPQKPSDETDESNNFSDEPLDDNFIKNNPFFSTLTSLED